MSTSMPLETSASSAEPLEAQGSGRLSTFLGWLVLLLITAVGAWYRFHLLELKPLHHDEGVNGWFIYRLLDEGIYRYNARNYHGPLLYILNTVPVILAGRTVAALRVAPALLGTLVIPAMVLFRRQLGWLGVLVSAAFIAVAPIEVYFSRTAIHEIYNFVFNMTFVGGLLYWTNRHDRRFLIVGALSLAFLFGTKETTIITVAAVVPALFVAILLGKASLRLPGGAVYVPTPATPVPPAEPASAAPAPDGALEPAMEASSQEAGPVSGAPPVTPPPSSMGAATRMGVRSYLKQTLLGDVWEYVLFVWRYLLAVYRADKKAFKSAGLAFGIAWFIMFSFFLNPKGLGSFFAAFFAWGDTGTAGKGHEKIWYYFFTHLLWPYYRPVIFAGMAGLIWGSLRRERLALFTLVWFVLAAAAYAVIPYKTPWCVLSFSNPLFIGTGILVYHSARVMREGSWAARAGNALAMLALLGLLVPYAVPLPKDMRDALAPPRGGTIMENFVKHFPISLARVFVPFSDSYTINFEEYDVKGHPFIYVQNVREYLELINDLHGLIETAQSEGDDDAPRILMIDAKNPMRWYLRSSGKQTWRGKLDDGAKKLIPQDVDVVVTSSQYSNELKTLLGTDFKLRKYHERPGRKIDVYVREVLWKRYEQLAKEGLVENKPSPAFTPRSTSDRRTAQMKESWSRKAMN